MWKCFYKTLYPEIYFAHLKADKEHTDNNIISTSANSDYSYYILFERLIDYIKKIEKKNDKISCMIVQSVL